MQCISAAYAVMRWLDGWLLLTFLTSIYRDFIFTLLVLSIVDICTARPTRVVVGLALNTVI